MINLQKDIIDQCQIIVKLIDVVYESSDDITVMASRSDKIKNLSKSIGNLMVKFEELGAAINREEDLNKLFSAIRLFENDIPKIQAIIDSGKYELPEKLGKTTLDNVNKNLVLLQSRLDRCILEIRFNLKLLNDVIREKVPSFSGLMGKLHGEETISENQKSEMSDEAMAIMQQINQSCRNVATNLDNVNTLTIGAIGYISRYFELLAREKEDSELTGLFDVIKMKQEKVKEVLVSE